MFSPHQRSASRYARPLFGLALSCLCALLAGCVEDGLPSTDVDAGASGGKTLVDGQSLAASDVANTAQTDATLSDGTIEDDAGDKDIYGWIQPTGGGQFIQLAVPGDPSSVFHGCAGGGTKRIYLAGTNGLVVGFDGLKWKSLTEHVFATLNGISAPVDGTRAFAAGIGGTSGQATAKSAGQLATKWGPPGGCTSSSDCDKNAPPCTISVCASGVCTYSPSGGDGCCGGVNFGDGFKNLGNWKVADLYAKEATKGEIVWAAAALEGANGKARYTSPPKALYFGLLDKACKDNAAKTCPSFDNGKVVGSTVTSNPIKLPLAKKIELSFQLFLDVETGTTSDLLTVTVKKQGYPDKTVWNKAKLQGSGSTDGKFKLQQVNLNEYAGNTITLQIRFDSKDAFINDGEGVFIDDILLTTTCPSGSGGTKTLTKSTFFDVFAYDDDNAWAVGTDGAIARWTTKASPDGGSKEGKWSLMTGDAIKDVFAISGLAGGLQLAVGQKGLIAEIDTGGLTTMDNNYPATLYGVAVTDMGGGKYHAVAVGSGGTVLEWNNGKWTKVSFPGASALRGVTAMGSGEYLAVGLSLIYRRAVNGIWQPIGQVPGTLRAITQVDKGKAFAVGNAGLLVEIQGTNISVKPKTFGTMDVAAITAIAPNSVWVVGSSGGTAHFDGSKWQGISSPAFANLTGAWGASSDNVFAVGLAGTIIRWNGLSWVPMVAPKFDYTAVWGSDPLDVYAAAKGGIIVRYDGKSWKVIVAPVKGNLRAVWASSPKDIWAVGENGAIFHSNGGGWSPVTVDPYELPDGKPYEVKSTLVTIWGSAANDVWASGYPDADGEGVLIHYDGKSWKYLEAFKEEGRVFRAIWGWSNKNVLFAGSMGMIYRFDGETLAPLKSGFSTTFYDVCGFGKDALMVGTNGIVLRYIPPLIKKKSE